MGIPNKGLKEMNHFLSLVAERFDAHYAGLVSFPRNVDHAYEVVGCPGNPSEVVPGEAVPDPFLAALVQDAWEVVWGNENEEAYEVLLRELRILREQIIICLNVAEELAPE